MGTNNDNKNPKKAKKAAKAAQVLRAQDWAQQVAASQGNTYEGPEATGSIFSNATPSQIAQAAESQATATAQANSQQQTTPPVTSALIDSTVISGVGEQIANSTDLALASQGANLKTQEEIERLRQSAATERTKLELENRIPEIEATSKGAIDLQKIVNEGYKNIKWMERSSNMFGSLMGAFNF